MKHHAEREWLLKTTTTTGNRSFRACELVAVHAEEPSPVHRPRAFRDADLGAHGEPRPKPMVPKPPEVDEDVTAC
jgi:hypothetical protein